VLTVALVCSDSSPESWITKNSLSPFCALDCECRFTISDSPDYSSEPSPTTSGIVSEGAEIAHSIPMRLIERTRPPVWRKISGKVWMGYGAALLGIAVVIGLLKVFGPHVNPTTAALAFLLVVLFVATAWGSRPAVFASLLGVAGFNFFFLPPFGTFAIRNPDFQRAPTAEPKRLSWPNRRSSGSITNFRTRSSVPARPKLSSKASD
jgi:hypothetical protein